MIFVEWIIWILQNQVFNFILLDSEIKYVLQIARTQLWPHNFVGKTKNLNRCSQQKFCDKTKIAEWSSEKDIKFKY